MWRIYHKSHNPEDLTNAMYTQQRKHYDIGRERHTWQQQRERDKRRNDQSFTMRRSKEPVEEQNRFNEEKDRNTQTQETEVATGREGAIRNVGTQGEIATKLKPVGEKDTQEKRGKKNN